VSLIRPTFSFGSALRLYIGTPLCVELVDCQSWFGISFTVSFELETEHVRPESSMTCKTGATVNLSLVEKLLFSMFFLVCFDELFLDIFLYCEPSGGIKEADSAEVGCLSISRCNLQAAAAVYYAVTDPIKVQNSCKGLEL
jgi:hypothetical protein